MRPPDSFGPAVTYALPIREQPTEHLLDCIEPSPVRDELHRRFHALTSTLQQLRDTLQTTPIEP